MNFLKKHKVITTVVLVAIAFVLYVFVTGGSEEEGVLTTDVVAEQTEGALAEEGLIALLLDLQSIELDSTLFRSQVFRGLIDFGQELSPHPIGRPNPFAPIGVDAAGVFEVFDEE